ncbi:hypothetical protein AMTRI_Chr11g100880 [Amborella trichopoda]
MEFVEGKLKEEKWFGEMVFPRTLLPSHGCEDGATTLSSPFHKHEGEETRLAEAVRANRVWLDEQLSRHGAILFRGFDVRRAEDFRSVVEAFGWEEMDYGIGDETRSKVIDRIYTANEAPPDLLIDFHHEMSPSLSAKACMLACEKQKSLLSLSALVDKRASRNSKYLLSFMSVSTVMASWNSSGLSFMALPKLGCNSVEFLEDGRAEFIYGPLNPIRTFQGGCRVWFSTIVGYTGKLDDMSLGFGDGVPFPDEAIKNYRKIRDENNVNIRWEKGDILLVDNLAVQHARRPGKPTRIILASLCK